ncbi:lysozyme inhibitor LprI family protein [Acinetobacter seifertii]|uniref:lysozyme inhibitor LprI family protein n=1 Tax=Acinetobacter seifertii TaxID=1530123 RepID=UPI0024DE25B6|nr:lysozyme inhibitor LprI family protein [Acinetobacter seifertii]
MKKLFLFSITSFLSVISWAGCNDPKNSNDIQQCLSTEITLLKKDLNITYAKLYKQTEAKQELDNAQKAWLKYKDLQCGDFTLADAGYSSGQVAYDLACQAELIEQRINFLKNQLN